MRPIVSIAFVIISHWRSKIAVLCPFFICSEFRRASSKDFTRSECLLDIKALGFVSLFLPFLASCFSSSAFNDSLKLGFILLCSIADFIFVSSLMDKSLLDFSEYPMYPQARNLNFSFCNATIRFDLSKIGGFRGMEELFLVFSFLICSGSPPMVFLTIALAFWSSFSFSKTTCR
eukprot:NODE_32_length_32166_cov_0.707737.p14 type:complete len:175 gc:universal NODE_32_length_32166_cov_0.707737:666-1190(+)